ncbi:MAG: class I SAM-dependent methyltransferase [Actinomycetota bacterium]
MPATDPPEALREKFLRVNQARWDELVDVHAASDHYNLEGFRAGAIRVRDYEIEDVGDVNGKSLLHLMCHLGIDTLSWARLGARVTGADFSPKAIDKAREIAGEVGIDATFVVGDIDSLPDKLDGTFDIVYTSRGVINWIPDLERWAEVIAHFLNPGGFFYVTEAHPFAQIFDHTPDLKVRFPYFFKEQPDALVVPGTYAQPDAHVKNLLEFGWSHGIGEIVTALAGAGLHIDFLREDPEGEWDRPFLEQTKDGKWRFPPDEGELPLWFSLKATKQAT